MSDLIEETDKLIAELIAARKADWEARGIKSVTKFISLLRPGPIKAGVVHELDVEGRSIGIYDIEIDLDMLEWMATEAVKHPAGVVGLSVKATPVTKPSKRGRASQRVSQRRRLEGK